jgi:hypothetical protein
MMNDLQPSVALCLLERPTRASPRIDYRCAEHEHRFAEHEYEYEYEYEYE